MRAEELIEAMSGFDLFKEVYRPVDVGASKVTYAVTQGQNILTIGSGKAERLKTLMGNKGSHNKAPIIGLCNRVFNEQIRFFKLIYTQDGNNTNSIEERQLQQVFGETNVEEHTSYREAMVYLRDQLNIEEGAIEAMLLDLMQTHGDILNHALNTHSTAYIVSDLFDNYWPVGRNVGPRPT